MTDANPRDGAGAEQNYVELFLWRAGVSIFLFTTTFLMIVDMARAYTEAARVALWLTIVATVLLSSLIVATAGTALRQLGVVERVRRRMARAKTLLAGDPADE